MGFGALMLLRVRKDSACTSRLCLAMVGTMKPMPSPHVVVPGPGGGADAAEVASARRAAWERLSKAELVALALDYRKVIIERSRELEVLERRLAKQSKGK